MIPFLIRQYLVPALQSLKCIYSNFCKSLRTISLLGSLRDLVGGVLHKTAVFPIIRAGVTDRYSHMPFFGTTISLRIAYCTRSIICLDEAWKAPTSTSSALRSHLNSSEYSICSCFNFRCNFLMWLDHFLDDAGQWT